MTDPEDVPASWLRRHRAVIAVLAVVVFGAAAMVGYEFMKLDHGPAGKPAIPAMKSDLRNLVSAEESYFAYNTAYTSRLSDIADKGKPYFTPSDSVTITMGPATATGWSATARHTATTRTCAVYVGTATPALAGQVEGEPKCDAAAAAPPR